MPRFLIVDDSLFSRKVTAHLLQGKLQEQEIGEFSIDFAEDGEAALAKFRVFRPDFIFIDLLMPKLSGIEFIRTVRKESRVGIFVVSADVQRKSREEALECGILDFVNKPLNDGKMSEICQKIKDVWNESGRNPV